MGGDAVAPATFGDLAVGQLVEATYAGPVAESYPSQGTAASVRILEEIPGPGPGPGAEIVATGTLGEPGTIGEDPEPVYPITDEASGTSYELISGFVELEPYVGERVTISGSPVPGPGSPDRPRLLNVTRITTVDDPGPSPGRSATLSFELAVDGTPPTDARFFGSIPAEGCISTPLTDSDGDGVFTGSVNVPRFAPGPVFPDTEPVSLPVQIVQANGGASPCDPTGVIRDFGSVKIDGDKTFEASISFPVDDCPLISSTPEECSGGSGNSGSGGSNGDSGSGSSSGNSGSGGSDSSSGGSGSGGSDSGGGSSGGAGGLGMLLPNTGGGMALTVLGAGAVLIAGGFLVRKLAKAL